MDFEWYSLVLSRLSASWSILRPAQYRGELGEKSEVEPQNRHMQVLCIISRCTLARSRINS